MKAANVSRPLGSALDSSRSCLQIQPEAKMHTNSNQGSTDDDNDMENVIIVRPKESSPTLTSPPTVPESPAHQTSPSRGLPLMTRPSPPKGSPIIPSGRESTLSGGQSTPPMFPQSIQPITSAGPVSPPPPMALPLRPATPNTFRASFGNWRAGFGSPGPLGLADGVLGSPAMASSNGKRKRMHPFQRPIDEDISSTIVVSRPSSISDKTDEDESENTGKKRKTKGIMKKTKTLAPVVLPSPGVERAELLFDMDRLSIENEAEGSGAGQQGKLGEAARIATGSNDNLENGNMQDDEEKVDGINGRNTTILEEGDENDVDHCMGETNPSASRTAKPLPSRRRFRSPPPPPVDMDEDGEDEAGNHAPHLGCQTSDDNGEALTPLISMVPGGEDDDDREALISPLLPISMIPGDEDEDDEEDLVTGSRGAFYYKPTPAERWARSQKRLQQIREYKAREAKEERDKRRRRRGSFSGARTGGGGIGGIGGRMSAVVKKVRFGS